MIRLRHIAALAVASWLAQPVHGQGLETAARDAQRYVGCIDALDIDCLETLTYPNYAVCDGIARLTSLIRMRDSIGGPGDLSDSDGTFWRIEPAAPVAIDSTDERLFVLVPLRVTFRIDQWGVLPRFLLGVSENDGESWRFIEDSIVRLSPVDLLVTGYSGAPLQPGLTAEPPADPQPAKSEYLTTREAGFILGTQEGDAHAVLTFEVRKRIREPITLFLAFQNPRASAEPILVNSILMPGQESFSVSSPPITGLLAKQYYEVVALGLDPDTEEAVFEHRQLLRYFPVRGYSDDVIPAIAGTPTRYSSLFARLAGSDSLMSMSVTTPVATIGYTTSNGLTPVDSTTSPLSPLNPPRTSTGSVAAPQSFGTPLLPIAACQQ